jgi:hypothetical protein
VAARPNVRLNGVSKPGRPATVGQHARDRAAPGRIGVGVTRQARVAAGRDLKDAGGVEQRHGDRGGDDHGGDDLGVLDRPLRRRGGGRARGAEVERGEVDDQPADPPVRLRERQLLPVHEVARGAGGIARQRIDRERAPAELPAAGDLLVGVRAAAGKRQNRRERDQEAGHDRRG